MIEVFQDWEYEPEACDCCTGYYNDRYRVAVNMEELPDKYSDVVSAIRAGLERLGITCVFHESEYPDDRD